MRYLQMFVDYFDLLRWFGDAVRLRWGWCGDGLGMVWIPPPTLSRRRAGLPLCRPPLYLHFILTPFTLRMPRGAVRRIDPAWFQGREMVRFRLGPFSTIFESIP